MRAYRGVVHANDFSLDLHEQFAKRHLVGPALLGRQVRETRVRAQPCEETVYGVRRAGKKEVDAFLG
jgi:hypothetical protein